MAESGAVENLICRRKSHYVGNEMNDEGARRRRSISRVAAAAAICLERVLVFCWTRRFYFVALVGLISFSGWCPIRTCSARPLIMDHHKRSPTTIMRNRLGQHESAAYDDELQTYLTEFGYLPRNNPEISNLRSDVAVKTALARLQQYAGLNVSSTLDEPTRKLLRRKRCGMADIEFDGDSNGRGRGARVKRFTLFGEKWRKLTLTYKVVNYSPHIDEGRTRRAVHEAFKLWSDASALEFLETSDDGADILIEFARGNHGDGYPFDGKNIVLAHAFFPGSGRGGDAHFDSDEVWTDQPLSADDYERVNFYTVAAHEFGHSLGLGHSKDRNALMFAYYRDYANLTKLPYDDAMAIQEAYGVGKYGAPDPPPATTEWPETNEPSVTYAPPAAVTTPTPNICHSRIDSVSRIRHEVFVFKQLYFWRYNDNGAITSDPIEISRFWHGLPDDFGHVDAVFERPKADTIVFFKGIWYWEFSGNYALPGYPKRVTSLGLPDDVKQIDAAFVWDWTKKAYLFAGDKYWRLNDDDMTVEHDYPRFIDKYWKGVPSNVDAAFTDKTGATYFFKDSNVYKFNDYFERVDKHYPVKISEFWTQCSANSKVDQLSHSRVVSSSGPSAKSFWRFSLLPLFILLQGLAAL